MKKQEKVQSSLDTSKIAIYSKRHFGNQKHEERLLSIKGGFRKTEIYLSMIIHTTGKNNRINEAPLVKKVLNNFSIARVKI